MGCVAMDEFHYFADPDRGWAWRVPLLTLPHTQFMLMSATLGDVTAIAASLEEHTGATCDLVVDAPPRAAELRLRDDLSRGHRRARDARRRGPALYRAL